MPAGERSVETLTPSRDESISDAQIVARLRKREPEAMCDLYDRYGNISYASFAGSSAIIISPKTWCRKHFCGFGPARTSTSRDVAPSATGL